MAIIAIQTNRNNVFRVAQGQVKNALDLSLSNPTS